MNLNGKNIIILGGSSGIGRAVAYAAHEAGANVTLTSRQLDRARSVAAKIGDTVGAAQLDLDKPIEIDALFSGLATVDHVYVAAGSTKLGALTDGSVEDSMAAFNTRVLGSLRVVKAVAGKVAPGGSVVFTGGVSTDRPIAGAWVSGLATASAEQLARVLVMEFPAIRFNAVSPGWTDTPMWDTVLGENKSEVLAGVAAGLPTKKIVSPKEVAHAVLFLMANAAITGEVVHVDGGGRLV